jgi:hypothetical protein
MPKNPDWSKCMFYRLVCRDISITECYVGSTCNEVKRRNCHKSKCTNKNDPAHNLFVYRFIRDHGSWDNWQLIVHEKRPMNNRYEAKIRERYWCEEYKAKLNKQVPSRTRAEYRIDHADEIIKKSAAYYIDHAVEKNQKQAAYDLANSERLKTKHTCACGGHYTTNGKSQHNNSKRHTAFEAAK